MSLKFQKTKKYFAYIGGIVLVFLFGYLGFNENKNVHSTLESGGIVWLFGQQVQADAPDGDTVGDTVGDAGDDDDDGDHDGG